MIAYRQTTPIDPVTDSTRYLRTLLVELLMLSKELCDSSSSSSPTQVRHQLALARLCARLLEGLAVRPVPHPVPAVREGIPARWNAWVEQATEDAGEQALWQTMLRQGQYLALVKQVECKLLPDRVAGRRRGMTVLTRDLAERAIALKQPGITWANLLDAIIRDLQAEPTLDAENQVLLTQLLHRQAACQPVDNGAYLRLIIGRYNAEPGLSLVETEPNHLSAAR